MGVELKKRSRRKAERPAEILDAAYEEFVKHGYAATRLEDVAARAGVTKGTIYFYFDTKERVFEEMVRHKSHAFLPELQAYTRRLTGSHAERLRALIVFTYSHIAEDRTARETMRFLISEGVRFPGLVDRHNAEFVQPIIQTFQSVIDAGVAAGEFRNTPAAGFTEIVMSPAVLLSLWTLLFGERNQFDMTAFTEASIDLIMNGLSK